MKNSKKKEKITGILCFNKLKAMEKERNYDNDGLDPSEEYFRNKKKGDDEDTYFPLEESEPPHY